MASCIQFERPQVVELRSWTPQQRPAHTTWNAWLRLVAVVVVTEVAQALVTPPLAETLCSLLPEVRCWLTCIWPFWAYSVHV